ncbi:hypothetical protein ICN40_04990 [Polynucleobacter sp. Fuers-14]|nr:hypothetical protein [Polynucleobacter sp. Fuers-14]
MTSLLLTELILSHSGIEFFAEIPNDSQQQKGESSKNTREHQEPCH